MRDRLGLLSTWMTSLIETCIDLGICHHVLRLAQVLRSLMMNGVAMCMPMRQFGKTGGMPRLYRLIFRQDNLLCIVKSILFAYQ